MLDITSPTQEAALGINFTDIYRKSELYRYNPITFLIITKIFHHVKNKLSLCQKFVLYNLFDAIWKIMALMEVLYYISL